MHLVSKDSRIILENRLKLFLGIDEEEKYKVIFWNRVSLRAAGYTLSPSLTWDQSFAPVAQRGRTFRPSFSSVRPGRPGHLADSPGRRRSLKRLER